MTHAHDPRGAPGPRGPHGTRPMPTWPTWPTWPYPKTKHANQCRRCRVPSVLSQPLPVPVPEPPSLPYTSIVAFYITSSSFAPLPLPLPLPCFSAPYFINSYAISNSWKRFESPPTLSGCTFVLKIKYLVRLSFAVADGSRSKSANAMLRAYSTGPFFLASPKTVDQ